MAATKGNLAGFRSGCTNNLIVADGVLNAPENTRSCSCAYQHQTSLAFVHMPDTEMWTYSTYDDPEPGTIRRLGLNFGAPGNRVDDSGLMWINQPTVPRVPSPVVAVEIDSHQGERYFADHSMTITRENGGHRWVGASGAKGVDGIRITGLFNDGGNPGSGSTYTVRLHFAEPEDLAPGERVFDVRVQSEKVLEKFDIVEKTGAAHRIFVAELENVSVGDGDAIEITFHAADDSAEPPLICGVEVQLEQD